MAQKPNGKADRGDRIVFTRAAAERIAKVVRNVEAGPRNGAGLYFPTLFDDSPYIRSGTFSSPWAQGSTNTITLANSAGTVTASNTLISYPASPSGKSSVKCLVAKAEAGWTLASFEVVTATITIVSALAAATALTNISLGATLNTTSCTISIAKTNTTASFSYVSATTSAVVLRLT